MVWWENYVRHWPIVRSIIKRSAIACLSILNRMDYPVLAHVWGENRDLKWVIQNDWICRFLTKYSAFWIQTKITEVSFTNLPTKNKKYLLESLIDNRLIYWKQKSGTHTGAEHWWSETRRKIHFLRRLNLCSPCSHYRLYATSEFGWNVHTTRILPGHGCFRNYSHRFGNAASPLRPANVRVHGVRARAAKMHHFDVCSTIEWWYARSFESIDDVTMLCRHLAKSAVLKELFNVLMPSLLNLIACCAIIRVDDVTLSQVGSGEHFLCRSSSTVKLSFCTWSFFRRKGALTADNSNRDRWMKKENKREVEVSARRSNYNITSSSKQI